MSFWTRYPYCNFHELNLNWILAKIKGIDERFNSQLDAYMQQYINDHLADMLLAASYDEATKTLIMEVTNA